MKDCVSAIRRGRAVTIENPSCKWCGKLAHRNANECDRCWELRHRIDLDVVLAARMLAAALEREEREAEEANLR